MIICQDLLSVPKGIIVHQVNCKGVMGRGLALAIRRKWPVVYDEYMRAYRQGKWSLGKIQLVEVGPELYVCNLAGQDGWGTRKQQTNYDALEEAFFKVRMFHRPTYAPWNFGCGLAGGDWSIVQPLVEKVFPDIVWVRQICDWQRQEDYRGVK